MKSKALVMLAVLVVLLASAVPSYAARGGGRGGGGHFGGGHVGGGHFGHVGAGHFGGGHFGGGRFHPGFHRGGGWWWPGAVVGGLALGAALGYPYYAYPYAPYPYYDPYQVAVPPTVVQEPPVAYQASPVQREVVYPNGKYVLYGDGVTQPWQWVWVPNAPPPPAGPPQ